MTDRELMQQALEALQAYGAHTPNCDHLMLLLSLPPQRKPCSCGLVATIAALRDRLAQPEQEPVAWRWRDVDGLETIQSVKPYHEAEPLYTAPPQRKPLTDEEISDAVREADFDWHYGWTLDDEEPNRFTKFARAIEAKLREKNGGGV